MGQLYRLEDTRSQRSTRMFMAKICQTSPMSVGLDTAKMLLSFWGAYATVSLSHVRLLQAGFSAYLNALSKSEKP